LEDVRLATASTVAEFVPCTRLAWFGKGDHLRAWLLIPRSDVGTFVVKEEVGLGEGARHLALTNPGQMHCGHHRWNISLKFACES
jgi:hypothetical protein